MTTADPTGRSSVIAGFRAFLADRGVSLEGLLASAGITPLDDLSSPIPPVPVEAVATVFELAAVRTGDPCFGLHYAEVFPAGGTGLLGHIVLAAPTVRDALGVIERYLDLHAHNLKPRYEEAGGVGRISISSTGLLGAPRAQYVSFLATLLVLRLRRAAGEGWQPLAAAFEFRSPPSIDEYRRIFGQRLTFDQPETGISVDATTLAKPMPALAAGLFESVRELGDRRLAALSTTHPMRRRVQEAIVERLGRGEQVDLDAVAGEIALQSRALQWRLEQEETTFDKVLVETRRGLAERYLRDSNLKLGEIAVRLGFSELSAFTRAAKSWFGVSPRLARQVLRGDPGARLQDEDA